MSALCLLAAGITVRIATAAFTLGWLHTVEHTRWEEDWRVDADRLVLVEARIQGSGAGMEPPPEARLENGRWVWRPAGRSQPDLVMRRAAGAGDWTLCAADGCRPLGARLGQDADPVMLMPCS